MVAAARSDGELETTDREFHDNFIALDLRLETMLVFARSLKNFFRLFLAWGFR